MASKRFWEVISSYNAATATNSKRQFGLSSSREYVACLKKMDQNLAVKSNEIEVVSQLLDRHFWKTIFYMRCYNKKSS